MPVGVSSSASGRSLFELFSYRATLAFNSRTSLLHKGSVAWPSAGEDVAIWRDAGLRTYETENILRFSDALKRHVRFRLLQYLHGHCPSHFTFFSRHFWHAMTARAASVCWGPKIRRALGREDLGDPGGADSSESRSGSLAIAYEYCRTSQDGIEG